MTYTDLGSIWLIYNKTSIRKYYIIRKGKLKGLVFKECNY